MIFRVKVHSVSIYNALKLKKQHLSKPFFFFIKNKSFCETAPKFLFLAPTYVPGFVYAPWLAF